ncbi:MAG TPA: ROK family protein [Anaerolineales bacterium]|nr:ROK family protein [Anaerolineales bacterium]
MKLELVQPALVPPLDPGFRPAVLANRLFLQQASSPLVIAIERSGGEITRFETKIFPAGDPKAGQNLEYSERIVKFLLWQRGGFKIYIGGSTKVAEYIRKTYSANGKRKFDYEFMGQKIYEQNFEVISCAVDEVPAARETGKLLGGHLQGARIGFDLGASDRKVSAVMDGKVIYSEEVIWEPRKHADPAYHYNEVKAAIETAASKLPRVDAIGGSSAGIYIDNRPMVASLFRKIPPHRYREIHDMFLRISDEMGVPLEIINDGDVTALAGAMSLKDNGILGIAMGSSEAAGYINTEGHIMGWLNELSFCPIDYNPKAAREEWSGDIGCGATYFSQQAVFRLAPAAGIEIPTGITDAAKLKFVQEKLESGHEGAIKIWQSIGIYLGYALAHYADFYNLKHVLILGRCTSGTGGNLILEGAKQVLAHEFPELAEKINIQLPDEKSRRVGQSIAAASLPHLKD